MCYFYRNCCKCLYTVGTVTFHDALFCCYCFFFFSFFFRIVTVCSHSADKHLRSTSLSFKDWTLFPHQSHHEYTKKSKFAHIYINIYIFRETSCSVAESLSFSCGSCFQNPLTLERERGRKKLNPQRLQ